MEQSLEKSGLDGLSAIKKLELQLIYSGGETAEKRRKELAEIKQKKEEEKSKNKKGKKASSLSEENSFIDKALQQFSSSNIIQNVTNVMSVGDGEEIISSSIDDRPAFLRKNS